MEQVSAFLSRFGIEPDPILGFATKYRIWIGVAACALVAVAANTDNYKPIGQSMSHRYLEARGQAPEQIAAVQEQAQKDAVAKQQNDQINADIEKLIAFHKDFLPVQTAILQKYHAMRDSIATQGKDPNNYAQYDLSPADGATHDGCNNALPKTFYNNIMGCAIYLSTRDKEAGHFFGYSKYEPVLVIALVIRLSKDDGYTVYDLDDLITYIWLMRYEDDLRKKTKPEKLPDLIANGNYNPQLVTYDMSGPFGDKLMQSITQQEGIKLNSETYPKLQELEKIVNSIYDQCMAIGYADGCIN